MKTNNQQGQMITHLTEIRYQHTRNTVEKGTVLPRYGNPEPIPIPEHTCDHIITGLPVPVSYPSCKVAKRGLGGVRVTGVIV
jgi:hypothetical protein